MVVSDVLTACAVMSGLVAAWHWYRASRVQPTPASAFEPVDPVLSHMDWISALLQAGQEAGRLNSIAALWTAASVTAGALASVAGRFGW